MRGDILRRTFAVGAVGVLAAACSAGAKSPTRTTAAAAGPSTSTSTTGGYAAFCSAVQQLAHGITPAATPAGVAAAHARVDALVTTAPAQVAPAVADMASQYNAVIDAFSANGYDLNRLMAHAAPSVVATVRRLASEANGGTATDPEATVFGFAEAHCASSPGAGTAQPSPGATQAPAAAAPSAGGIPSAASLVATAMANAAAKQWAHIDVTNTSGSDTTVFSDDSGPTSGHQIVTINGAHAEALVVGGVAYAMGDASAVTNYFGFPAADAARLAGRWISLQPSDQGFSDVSAGVTLPSALSETDLTGPYHISAVTVVDGQRVVAIGVNVAATSGGPSATGTLYITPGSATLPVEVDLVGSDGSKTTEKFSRWGVAVAITAPSSATPAASIGTSSTSS